METFSDDWMADGNGDDVPDVAIGRLPVISVAELQTVVGKILAYEAQPAAPRAVVSVADVNDTYDFGGATERLSGVLPAPTIVTSIHRSAIGDAAARAAVLESFTAGSDLVVFAGHGSVTVWRGGLLTSADVMAIDSSGRLSVSVLANCLNGYFAAPGLHSIGEALVLSPGGGSVVSYSSSGTSDSGWQELLISEFLRVAYQPGMTAGNAARIAKASVNGDVRKTWVLLGDPLVRLR